MKQNFKTGFSNSLRLHVHEKPDLESEVVCKLRYLTEVAIDEDESTDEFYKICTAIGAEGYVPRDCVMIRQ